MVIRRVSSSLVSAQCSQFAPTSICCAAKCGVNFAPITPNQRSRLCFEYDGLECSEKDWTVEWGLRILVEVFNAGDSDTKRPTLALNCCSWRERSNLDGLTRLWRPQLRASITTLTLAYLPSGKRGSLKCVCLARDCLPARIGTSNSQTSPFDRLTSATLRLVTDRGPGVILKKILPNRFMATPLSEFGDRP